MESKKERDKIGDGEKAALKLRINQGRRSNKEGGKLVDRCSSKKSDFVIFLCNSLHKFTSWQDRSVYDYMRYTCVLGSE